jgi:hypothetical protein
MPKRPTTTEHHIATEGHREWCEGHIDCPNCGPESCSRPVVWQEPGSVPVTVLRLSCYKTFNVEVDESADDGA